MLRWKASSTRSRPNSSITVTTQNGQKLSAISLPSSKVTTTEPESTRPSATSARSRWSKKQLNPVHFFGGRSELAEAEELLASARQEMTRKEEAITVVDRRLRDLDIRL